MQNDVTRSEYNYPGMIVHKNLQPIAVAAAVFIRGNSVLVARRARGQHLEYKWEFPGGKLEENETPEECLQREICEELGVTIKVCDYIGESVFRYPDKTIRLIAHQVELVSGDFLFRVHDLINWVDIHDLLQVDLAEADIAIASIVQERLLGRKSRESRFYDSHYQEYCDRTFNISPGYFLAPLISNLSPEAKILDIGCGSGRDLLWLTNKGFRPTGFERSKNLAALARQNSGCPVLEGDFTLFNFADLRFDAVLMIGAMVHLRHSAVAPALSRISKSLIGGGLIYLTLKEGEGTYGDKDGRFFSLWQTEELQEIFEDYGFRVLSFSRDISALNQESIWLAFLLENPGNRLLTASATSY